MYHHVQQILYSISLHVDVHVYIMILHRHYHGGHAYQGDDLCRLILFQIFHLEVYTRIKKENYRRSTRQR
jgi:hypothetical protein